MPVVVPAQPRLLPSGLARCGRALGCDGCRWRCRGVGGCCCGAGCCCSAPVCRAPTCPGGTEVVSGPAAAPAWSCQCRVWPPRVLGTELVPGLAEAPTGAGRSCGRSRLWRTCPCASPGRDSVSGRSRELQGGAGTRVLGTLTSRRPLPLLPPSSPFFPSLPLRPQAPIPSPSAALILLSPLPRRGDVGGLSPCSKEP